MMAMVSPICRDELLFDTCSMTPLMTSFLGIASEITMMVSLMPERVLGVGMRSVWIMSVSN